jgi:hypothetical protein
MYLAFLTTNDANDFVFSFSFFFFFAVCAWFSFVFRAAAAAAAVGAMCLHKRKACQKRGQARRKSGRRGCRPALATRWPPSNKNRSPREAIALAVSTETVVVCKGFALVYSMRPMSSKVKYGVQIKRGLLHKLCNSRRLKQQANHLRVPMFAGPSNGVVVPRRRIHSTILQQQANHLHMPLCTRPSNRVAGICGRIGTTILQQ